MSAEKKQNSSVKKESNKTTNQKNTNTKPKTTTKQEVKPKTSTTSKATTKPAAAKPVAKKTEGAKSKTTTATTTKPKTTSKPVEHKTNNAKKPEPSKEVKKVEKTTKVDSTKKESKNEEANSDNVIKTVVIIVIVLALIGLLVWVIIKATNAYKPTSYLDVALTSENYDEMVNKFNKEMKKENEPGYKDEYYYFNYAFNSHMFDDAASTVSQNPEENTTIPAQYKYIYGKTIHNVIDEGKKLMEEKHFSLSDYIDYLNSLTKDPNLQNLSNATLNN